LNSGSHPELVGAAGAGFETAEEAPGAIEQVIDRHTEFVSRIAPPDLNAVADRYLDVMGLPSRPQPA